METINGRFITLVILAMILFAVDTAFPNGINPPRPAGSILVNAICKYKKNNKQAEVFRTKVKYGDVTKMKLDLKIGDDTEEIEISDISSITSISNSIDADGFAKATMIRADDTEKEEVSLKVKSKGANIKLVGFDKDGNKKRVNLSDCKSVEFSSIQKSQKEENRPAVAE